MTPAGRPTRRVKDPTLEKKLRAVSKAIRDREALNRTAAQTRDQLIRQALAGGWTQAQVSEVTGLHPARVSQIVQEQDR